MIVFAIILTSFTTYLVVRPSTFFIDLFDLMPYQDNQDEINLFRIKLLIFPILQLIISFIIEVWIKNEKNKTNDILSIFFVYKLLFVLFQFQICERQWFRQFIHVLCQKRLPKNKFKIIQNDVHAIQRHWLDALHPIVPDVDHYRIQLT